MRSSWLTCLRLSGQAGLLRVQGSIKIVLPRGDVSLKVACPNQVICTPCISIEPSFWVLIPLTGERGKYAARRRGILKRNAQTVRHPCGCTSVPFDKDTRRDRSSSL